MGISLVIPQVYPEQVKTLLENKLDSDKRLKSKKKKINDNPPGRIPWWSFEDVIVLI